MISVERFGGGALRVSYDDGRDDWMFWPFEEGADCEQAFVTGESTFWVYRRRNGIEAAIFDAGQRVCVQRNQFGAHESFANRRGDHLVLHRLRDSHSNPDRTNHIAIVRGSDLSETLRIEDSRLYIKTSIYQRSDGAIIVGTPAGPDQAAWIVTFDGGEASMKELPGSLVPQGLGAKSRYGDPTGRRVATVGAETAPIERAGNETLYGIPVQLWDLGSLKVEKTVIVDRVPAEFSAGFAGQNRLARGDVHRQKWEQRLAAINPAVWDGSLNDGDADLDAARCDFICSNISDIAWEPDGEAFWAVFAAGYLRRVSVDGSVSPRYVVQRMATPPVMGKRRWFKTSFELLQKPSSLEYLPNGELRIMTMHAMSLIAKDFNNMVRYADQGGVVQFDPSRFSREGGLIRRLLAPLAGSRVDGILVSTWRDGFIPQEHSDFKRLLETTRGDGVAVRRKDKAIEARKAAFLKGTAAPAKKTAASGKKAAAAKAGEPPVAAPDPKPPLEPGSIDVEKFGYTCGGALRVEYVGSGEDWMFLPFRDRDLQEFHVLGDDRILAYASQQLALFDVRKKECVARQEVGVNLKLHVSKNAEWVSLVGKMDGEKESLTVFNGHDLREIFRMEEEGLSYIRPIYERDDGALLVGGMTPGPVQTVYVVAFEDGMPRVEKREDTALPGSYKANWPCPTRKRVLALPGDRIPVMEEPGGKSFGVSLDVWNLTTLEIERTAVVDRLPANHQAIQKFALTGWDGSLKPDPSLDHAAQSEILGFGKRWKTLFEMHLRAIAWEPNGEAFWAAFAGGYLRRATVDGSLSPRLVPERLRQSDSVGQDTSDIREMAVLSDGRIRIEFYGIKADRTRYFVCFQPPAAGVLADAQGPDIRIPESEDGLGQVLFGYPTVDEDLKARMKAFEERAQDAPTPLADMSEASCIDAIERLTAAIEKDPYELVCGSSFRPTFVLPANGSSGRRMGEDVFFAHVAANAPEARPAIERLLHTWMDKVPLAAKHRNYYMNDQTVALSHALKALITLDPCCYDTIRRYVTETDLGHDVIIQQEVLPYFGEANGWRDLEAIKLGIFIMLGAWCGGSGGSWIDPTMQQKVMQTMGGREFAELLVRETERYYSPDEASFNREAWDHNGVRSYLEICEMYNFQTPDAFDREAVAVINEYLKRQRE